MNKIKVNELLDDWLSANYEIVTKQDLVDCCYGIEYLKITDEDLEKLKKGNCIYCEINAAEYALVISLGGMK